MASNFLNPYVQCPFFQYADDGHKLTCEGPVKDTDLILKFKNKKTQKTDKKIYMKTICCGKYEHCMIYQMLEKKYEEE